MHSDTAILVPCRLPKRCGAPCALGGSFGGLTCSTLPKRGPKLLDKYRRTSSSCEVVLQASSMQCEFNTFIVYLSTWRELYSIARRNEGCHHVFTSYDPYNHRSLYFVISHASFTPVEHAEGKAPSIITKPWGLIEVHLQTTSRSEWSAYISRKNANQIILAVGNSTIYRSRIIRTEIQTILMPLSDLSRYLRLMAS